MIKLMLFMKRRGDLSLAAFREHYETSHVKLTFENLPEMRKHVRNYVVTRHGEPELDYDVITECWFDDWDAMKKTAALLAGEKRAIIQADEEKFLDRSVSRMHVVEEHVSYPPGAARTDV